MFLLLSTSRMKPKLKSWWVILVSLLVILATTQSALFPSSDIEDEQIGRNTRSAIDGSGTNITLSPDSGSLDEALRNIDSNTNILLMQGTYQLESFTLVTGVSNICISGQGYVAITCNKTVGLAFVNVSNLVIEGVRIERCGLSDSHLNFTLNHIREFVDLFFVVYSEMRFAVLLGHCENVIIDNVQVMNNVGFGLVGINLIGSSVIKRLSAINNIQPSCAVFSIASHLWIP